MNEYVENEVSQQRLAELAENERLLAGGGGAGLNCYRLVVRALRQPLKVELHEDFSEQVMRRIAERERRTASEDRILTGLLALLVVLGLWSIHPFLFESVVQIRGHMPLVDGLTAGLQEHMTQLPWPMLGVAAIGLGGAAILDVLFGRPMGLAR